MLVKTGSYVGNATDNTDITGVGFQPVFVLTRRATGGVATDTSVYKTPSMAGDISVIWQDFGFPLSIEPTDGIKTLLSDGFRIGTGPYANASGVTYHWLALGADSAVLFSGVYLTDNTDNRQITGFGFQPDFLFGGLGGPEGFDQHHWFQSKGGDNSHRVANSSFFNEANYFQQALADGMEVGDDQNFHSVSSNRVYFTGLKIAAGNIAQGSYVGDGVFGRAVTGLGFKPDFVWIRREGASTSTYKFASQDSTFSYFAGISGENTAGIQDFISDGFTVGSTGPTNNNLDTYHFIALASPPPVGAMPVATGTYTGTGSDQSIVGLGFQPVFVMTRHSTTPSGATGLKTSAMGGNISISWDQFSGDFRIGGVTDTGIRSLDADGFTVRSALEANSTGGVYHWVAFGADADVLFNGSYTGTGSDNRQITGVGFRADALLGARSTTSGSDWGWWFQTLGLDNTILVSRDDDAQLDRFQDAIEDQIEVGTVFNFSGTSHFFTAFKIATGNIAQGTYTGNGTSQSISGLGFQPDIVFIKKNTASPNGDRTIYRQATQTGDATFKLLVGGEQTGMITSLDADGFSVGSAVEANDSGDTYHYLAISSPTAPFTALSALAILPIESVLKQSISNILPVELLRRIAQSQNVEYEFNVTEILVAGQLLPIEALLGVTDSMILPVDAAGTTPIVSSMHLSIETIGALAAEMNLHIESIARQVAEQRIPFEALAGLGTPSNLAVEMLGSIQVKAGQNMSIEFLQGIKAPPVLPVDVFGVTILKAPANVPIESIVGLVGNMIMPVEATGIGFAIAALFQVIRPLQEPLSVEFIVIPLQLLNPILPITFNIENILGKKLSVSFRILPDDILTLFGEDIQFPFGRADKNP